MYIQTISGLEQATTTLDINKAIRSNRVYRQTLGWQTDYDNIIKFLGFTAKPSEIEFAQGVAQWQQSRSMNVDGMIGPSTWKAMQAAIIRTTSDASAQRVTNSPQIELPLPPARELSFSDVMDERISVPAQYSLVRLSKNRATSADAIGMLEEVKAGRLAGIYCVNWRKSAQRALKFGKSWWAVIPQGEDAILMLDPDNLLAGQPMITFRRELSPYCGLLKDEKRFPGSPARLDAALLKAWSSYRLWQAGQQRGRLSCRPMPNLDDRVLAGSQIHGLSSARTLSNVMPPLFCEASQIRCQTILQNAESDLKKYGWTLADYRFHTIAFDGTEVLATNGRGFGRLAAHVAPNMPSHGPNGRVFFAKTTNRNVPQLWAVFVPNGLNFEEPVPFHVFFTPKPTSQQIASKPYPYGKEWNAHVDRYMVNIEKKLLQQHSASGKKCIFVLPIARPDGTVYGDLATAKKLRRHLLELLCWLGTSVLQTAKLPRLGYCAVSGFSYAGNLLKAIMQSSLKNEFPELEEIYCLDTIYISSENTGAVTTFANTIQDWLRSDAHRVIRIYTSYPNIASRRPSLFLGKPKKNLGAEEWQVANGTFVYTPKTFWDTVFKEQNQFQQTQTSPAHVYPGRDKQPPHQLIPCVFLQHALKNSRFPNV